MSETIFIAALAVGLVAMLVAGRMLYRLFIRAVFALADWLPPYRPQGRYRSQSAPEKYASLAKRRRGADRP